MRGSYRARQIKSRLVGTARSIPEIARIARMPDHRREPVARKPMYRRFLDLAYISLRWGEVSNAYCAQGADCVGRQLRRDYIPYPLFRRVRDSRNRCRGTGAPYDYVCLLQDKRLFARYFGAAGLPVMATVCEIGPAEGLSFDDRSGRSFDELAQRHGTPLSLFFKPRFGIHGKDVFTLEITDAGAYADGVPIDAETLARRLREPCIGQHQITQHPDLARPHPASVNTLRIVTVRSGKQPEILFASLKLGAGGHVTDNGGDERCVIRIDPDTGRLYETGFWKHSERHLEEVCEHRESGVRFRDYMVPFFDDCAELSRRAHDWLPETYSIGWDLAVTTDGPVLLEGNDDWSGATSMNYADVRERFLRAHLLPASPATTPAAR